MFYGTVQHIQMIVYGKKFEFLRYDPAYPNDFYIGEKVEFLSYNPVLPIDCL